jgi:hypothetical protein
MVVRHLGKTSGKLFVGSMTILGILVFLGLWLFAIAEYGVFWGLGAGWIPAAFFSILLDLALFAVLGTSSAIIATRTRGDLRKPILGVRKISLKVLRILGICAFITTMLAGIFLVFENERNGACVRLAQMEQEFDETRTWFSSQGVEIADILKLDPIQFSAKYSVDLALRRHIFGAASRKREEQRSRLEWPNLCPLTPLTSSPDESTRITTAFMLTASVAAAVGLLLLEG